MKHRLLFFFLSIFLFLTSVNAQYVLNPLSPNIKKETNIDTAIITITPFVNYAQVDLTLNYSAKNTSFVSNGPSLWLEVLTDFNIPKNTIVVDSWLWIEDYISEAYLIDLYTATNVYESYVTRTQDPSLLRYASGHDDRLALNIYPLPADGYRKIKLSFLVPIVEETNAFSIDPIKDILMKENHNAISYCEIKVNNNATYTSGSLRTAIGNTLIKESNPNFTVYNMVLHNIDPTFAITYDKVTPNKNFSFYESTDLNYYALETFVPFDFANCTFAGVNKVMNDSSLVYNEYNTVEIFNSGFSYQESGNYFNDPPENFVLEYICGNQVFKDSLNLTGIESPLTDKIWARDKIMDLTQNKTNSYSYYYNSPDEPNYVDLLLTSMDYRVLSFYTAFLALPQEDTVEASLENNGFNDFNVFVGIENVLLKEPSVNCYPNPFKEKLTIQIKLPNNQDLTNATIRIIDISGKTVHNFEDINASTDKEFNLEWLANEDITKGIYFVLLELNGETYTYEVMKD